MNSRENNEANKIKRTTSNESIGATYRGEQLRKKLLIKLNNLTSNASEV